MVLYDTYGKDIYHSKIQTNQKKSNGRTFQKSVLRYLFQILPLQNSFYHQNLIHLKLSNFYKYMAQ